MSAPTPLAHYQAMAEQAMRDNRNPAPAPRAPLLMSGFEHCGCRFDIYGTFDVDGSVISEVRATGDLFDFLDGETVYKMVTACDRAALKERDASRADAVISDREFA